MLNRLFRLDQYLRPPGPFSFSIAHGIAAGFITYTAIKLLSGRISQLRPAVAVLAVLFVVKFVFLGT